MSGPIDFFLVAGQSNAVGYGDSALSPATVAGEAFEVRDNTFSIQQLADPVRLANTGSAWPAFANAYTPVAGVPMAASISARTSTTLLAENDGGPGNWSPTGTLRAAAVAIAEGAMSALTTAGWTPTLRGVLWAQGEYDALYGNTDPDLATKYEAALIALHDYFRTELDPALPMYVWRSGASNTGGYPAGFAAVRAAQDAACASTEGLVMVYTDTINFPALGYMEDAFHYNQTGLNLMGTEGAAVVAEDIYPTPVTPVVGRSSVLARRLLLGM